jgi:antirestriction protein ArdC
MPKNLHAAITAKIVARLDAGVIPWRKPWRSYGSGNMPRNAITSRSYSGANVVLLWIDAEAKGYTTPKWLTCKQATEAGGQVRKGEKGSQITFLGRLVKEDEKTGRERAIPFLKAYTVFNVDQCDGLDHVRDDAPKIINPGSRDELADEFMRSTGASIRHRESRAYYASKGDYVNLPMFEAFKGAEEYYSTAFHELMHWTGAEHRLNRTFGKRFGDATYSAEELVAELGSAFLCAEFGFDNSTLDNSAAYIDHWRRFLTEHEKAFVEAASKASRAVEFMRGLALADQPEELPIAA